MNKIYNVNYISIIQGSDQKNRISVHPWNFWRVLLENQLWTRIGDPKDWVPIRGHRKSTNENCWFPRPWVLHRAGKYWRMFGIESDQLGGRRASKSLHYETRLAVIEFERRKKWKPILLSHSTQKSQNTQSNPTSLCPKQLVEEEKQSAQKSGGCLLK